MLQLRTKETLDQGDHGWLKARHHFVVSARGNAANSPLGALVVWNDDDSVYRQTLQDTIMDLVAAGPEAALVDKPGGIFARRGEQMRMEMRRLNNRVRTQMNTATPFTGAPA